MDIDRIVVQTLLSTFMDQFLVKCSLLQNDVVNNFSKRAYNHALNSSKSPYNIISQLPEDSQQETYTKCNLKM
ncbi:hypothetical protein CAJAP_06695 [Camponotus japonicus]